MLSKLEGTKEFSSSNFAIPKRRSSSSFNGAKSQTAPWQSRHISKERKFELVTRFNFKDQEIRVYEKLISMMKGLSESETTSIVTDLLATSLNPD